MKTALDRISAFHDGPLVGYFVGTREVGANVGNYVREDIYNAKATEAEQLNFLLDAIMSDASWTPKHPACEKILERINDFRRAEQNENET